MEYGARLAEGKTKIIYAHPDDARLAVMVQKDAISAGDGARRDTIEGKGALSGRTAANVFGLLNRAGIATHFVQAPSDNEMIVQRCSMIPLEVVMRRIATGSFLKRYPEAEEGQRFNPVLVEFFFKDDARHDPQMQPEEIEREGIAGHEDVEAMIAAAREVFSILEQAWAELDIQLVDLKIEFGRRSDGSLLVADMIDNDSWRLWPGGNKESMLDKQIYRNMQAVTPGGLADVKSKYAQVAALTDRFAAPDRAMQDKLGELRRTLLEIDDLRSAAALLYWDQTTYMPAGGALARARQLATLEKLAHVRLIDGKVALLLEDLRPYEESLPYDSDHASLIRVSRREYEQRSRQSPSFVTRLSTHTSTTYQTWTQARPANDFKAMQPYLETMLELSRELAEFFPGYAHIADPLIAFDDYGMSVATVRELFTALREQLVPLVNTITSQPPADDSCLHQVFPEAQQWAFGLDVIKRFGYDFERGRLDKTHHPYMTKFSLGDVRITTRIHEHDLSDGLFSTMHEAGHALYEQGIRADFEGTPLAAGTSAGIHESQSRLWENLVGRSRGFWRFWYPKLQAVFPQQLGSVPLEDFYRAINKVQRSLIRVDADEVTYNLHVLIRFDLELAMLEGRLAIRDLPEAWRERYKSDLGVAPPDDRDGVLQDVHWYGGWIGGAFQGYTLGNILSAQFFEAALSAHPNIPSEIEAGEYGTLHGWLRENIYQHGSKYTAAEVVERATGSSLSIDPYIRYLRTKYGELYQL